MRKTRIYIKKVFGVFTILLILCSCIRQNKEPFNLFINILPVNQNTGFKMDDYWIWGGSAVQGDDGRYHLFVSRWPKKYMMHPGWIFYSEIVRASADNTEGPYNFEEVVLPPRDEKYFDGKVTHNPAIRKYKDTYLLFYMGTTFSDSTLTDKEGIIAGKADSQNPYTGYRNAWNGKRIGLAWSNSVKGPWQRREEPLLQPRPGKWDELIISNPAPWIMPDGTVYLIYKSAKMVDGKRGPFSLGVAKAENYRADFKRLSDDPVISFPDGGSVEDPFLWHDGTRFNLIMKDIKGNIAGEEGGGIHMISDDCIQWQLTEHKKAYSRTLLFENGDTITMGAFERPQLLIENGIPKYLFAATADGNGGFVKADKTWNICVPVGK